MTNISGGCLCEKVRYAITSPPLSQGICYCRQCRKSGGACGSPLLVLREETFKYTKDALSFCQTTSNRGSTVSRNFCRECGSHVFSQISDVPGIVTVKAATLDNFATFIPQYIVWVRNVGPNFSPPSGLPTFQENAPLELVLGSIGIKAGD